jgi:hypothetical protein
MLKGQLGYVSATSFSLDMLLSSGNAFARANYKSQQADALLFDLGVAGIIPVNDLIFLNIGLDYLAASPTFKSVEYAITSSAAPPEYGTVDIKMEMKWINLNLGIVKQF